MHFEALPESVCYACSQYAIQSYIFLKLCQSLTRNLENLYKTILITKENEDAKSVFLFIDKAEVIADKNENLNKWRVLKLINSRIKSKQKDISLHESVQCEDCGRVFSSAAFNKHTAAHKKAVLTCEICAKTCSSKKQLRLHTARAHDEKKFKCPHCDKCFGSQFLVDEHVYGQHTYGECKTCGKSYTRRRALRAHEDTHNGIFTCSKCNKSYKYKEGLRQHANVCFKGALMEKYTCHDCGKSYPYKGSLTAHIKFAHSDDPYKCHVCGQRFLAKCTLSNHMSKHTGIKNYKCELCGGTFTHLSTLQYHIRAIHTRERPYGCDECGKCFVSSALRLVHKRRHHGAPAPQCDLCAIRFVTPLSYKKHMKNKHSELLGDCLGLFNLRSCP